MTCFWDAILGTLNKEDYELLGFKSRPNHHKFIARLQELNTYAKDVLWNGEQLKKQELEEHMEAVKCYDKTKIHKGHLTSTCDSFLLLLCQLLKIKITHKYLKKNITYENGERRIFHFCSNRSHFTKG